MGLFGKIKKLAKDAVKESGLESELTEKLEKLVKENITDNELTKKFEDSAKKGFETASEQLQKISKDIDEKKKEFLK